MVTATPSPPASSTASAALVLDHIRDLGLVVAADRAGDDRAEVVGPTTTAVPVDVVVVAGTAHCFAPDVLPAEPTAPLDGDRRRAAAGVPDAAVAVDGVATTAGQADVE